MNVKKEIIELINHYKELIDANDFISFYSAIGDQPFTNSISECTELFLNAGINPLYYMNHIPPHFLSFSKTINTITIPNNIKLMGESAFYNSNIKYVDVSNQLLNVARFAFQFCTKLDKIDLKNIALIEENAFSNCVSLKSVDAPHVKRLKDYAFSNCENLEFILLGEDLNLIEKNIFYNCQKLNKIYYTGSIEQWNKIEIATPNITIERATIICKK